MKNQFTEFTEAVNGAACKIFTDYGEAVTALQTVALIAPPARPVAVGLGLAQMAAKQNCNWDTEQEGPPGSVKGGCWKLENGGGLLYSKDVNGNFAGQVAGSCGNADNQFVAISGVEQVDGQNRIGLERLTGGTTTAYGGPGQAAFYLEPCPGANCAGDDPPAPPPPPPTYIHTTEDGCQLNVNFQGWGQLPDGSASGIFLIEPSATQRSGGGVIGGCNFSPTIVYNPGGSGGGDGGGDGGGTGGGGGGGSYSVPFLPGSDDDGKPNWAPLLEAALTGLAGAAINQALDAALAKVYDGAIYRMEAPCDKDQDGNPLIWEKEIPPAPSTDALGYRLTAIHEQISQALAWKTPICNEKPALEGDWVTLRFVSDEPSPNSNRVVRKLLRYRSKSGAELGSITDYWRGFTWTTGAVIVTHADAWWGQPKCWAVSAYEGKRVLRHAAGEAGIDPDQVGRWIISGSRDPRYGVSLPVRFADLDGGPWVTQRDSPSGPSEINR
jgi:hypothetical protein